MNNFLKKLDISKNSESANKNSYDEIAKKFSIYLYCVERRLLYETLHENLSNALSSISTLNRYLYNKYIDTLRKEK